MRRNSLSVIPQTLLLYGLRAQSDAGLPRLSGSVHAARQLRHVPPAWRAPLPLPKGRSPLARAGPAPRCHRPGTAVPQGHCCQHTTAGPARGKAERSLCTPDSSHHLLPHRQHGRCCFLLLVRSLCCPQNDELPPAAGPARLSLVCPRATGWMRRLSAKETRHGAEGALRRAADSHRLQLGDRR